MDEIKLEQMRKAIEQLTAAMQDDQKDNAAWRETEEQPYQKGYYTGRRDEAMAVLNFLAALK
jgi:hypothetical protein